MYYTSRHEKQFVQSIVLKGHPTIAQRLIAGKGEKSVNRVLRGRLNSPAEVKNSHSLQSSFQDFPTVFWRFPGSELAGYFHVSLQDKNGCGTTRTLPWGFILLPLWGEKRVIHNIPVLITASIRSPFHCRCRRVAFQSQLRPSVAGASTSIFFQLGHQWIGLDALDSFRRDLDRFADFNGNLHWGRKKQGRISFLLNWWVACDTIRVR